MIPTKDIIHRVDNSQVIIKAKSKKFRTRFLTPGAKLAFVKLRQAFNTPPILHYSDLKYHICIKTDVSDYPIGGIFSQLTLDNFGQWHPMPFFSQQKFLKEM